MPPTGTGPPGTDPTRLPVVRIRLQAAATSPPTRLAVALTAIPAPVDTTAAAPSGASAARRPSTAAPGATPTSASAGN